MPRVLNKAYDEIPGDAVYVGRPSKWGNPFKIGQDGTRIEVLTKFKHWFQGRRDLQEDLRELKGHDLVCWCAPKACHADMLLAWANTDEVG